MKKGDPRKMKTFPTVSFLAAVLAYFLLTTPSNSAEATGSTETYLKCGKVFDAKAAKVTGPATIIVRGDRIARIEQGFKRATPKAKTVNLVDSICLPGLIDTHIHFEQNLPELESSSHAAEARLALEALESPKKLLFAGFTTVRDLASTRNIAMTFREAVRAGKIVGPRILTAGVPVSAPGGHGDHLPKIPINARPDARELTKAYYGLIAVREPSDVALWYTQNLEKLPAFRKEHKQGQGDDVYPDAIKIMATGGVISLNPDSHRPQLSREVIAEVVRLAKVYAEKIGRPLPVTAHAHGLDGIANAVFAGVNSIEHGTELGADIVPPANEDEAKRRRELRAQVIADMKSKNVYLVPTLYAAQSAMNHARAGKVPPAVQEKALRVGRAMLENFQKVVDSGVPLAFGSDSGVGPHGENYQELILLVRRGGMAPRIALQMATLKAARVIGQEENLGTLEPGKYADIIALPEAVTTEIERVADVRFVMASGVIHKR